MNKRLTFLFALVLLGISSVQGADVKLPPPQTSGGKPVLDALASRASASGREFPSGKISEAELSTLLWAASGLNRQPKGWTIPLAMGVEPYCRIYVAGAGGVHLYSWQDHSLQEISREDIRSKISSQPFAARASHFLIFVTDRSPLKKAGRMGVRWDEWLDVAVGAMTQNVYLAADSLGIGVRFVAMMDMTLIRKTLPIPDDEKPVCIFPMAKY